MNNFVAIVPAAGNSNRYSGEIPKQFLAIEGRTVLELSIRPILDFSECLGVCVLVPPEDQYHKALEIRDNPKIFLFDEPLSNLDAKLRIQMRLEIKKLQRKVGVTSIFVTHDQVEAMTLADRVVVMKDGKIEQIGTPDEIYNFPKTGFVAGFIGSPAMNFIPSKIIKNGENFSVYVNENVSFSIDKDKQKNIRAYEGKDVLLGIRPEHISEKKSEDAIEFDTKIDLVEPLGMETMVYFTINKVQLCGKVSPETNLVSNNTISLNFDKNKFHIIDPQTDKVL